MKAIPYGHQKIDSDDIKEVARTLKSDWITQGPKVKEFEEALSKYTGAKYAVAVSSGTAALHIACLAGGIKKGDEVITSPITFVASANCVLYCGGRPVFADIREDTVNIDPQEIEKSVNKKTKAIIVVHFAGHPADMEEIHSIAQRHNLIVIEDAAHALGATYKKSKIGSSRHSDMAVFSFHPVKSITTGEGGAVLTNRKDLYEKLLMFRNHGITKDRARFTVYGPSTALGMVRPSTGSGRMVSSVESIRGMVSPSNHLRFTEPWYYEQQCLGFNYRITDFQCALGISQLKKIDEFVEKRRKIAALYTDELSEIDGIITPKEKEYVKSSWHIYYIRLKDYTKRKPLFEKLERLGIRPQVHYIPVHLQPYYKKEFGYREGDYPNAENYYKSTITIPLYPAMRDKDVRFVIKALRKVIK